jgi:hypothetical protein
MYTLYGYKHFSLSKKLGEHTSNIFQRGMEFTIAWHLFFKSTNFNKAKIKKDGIYTFKYLGLRNLAY